MTGEEVRDWLLENKLFDQKGYVKRYFVKMDYIALLSETKENPTTITQIYEVLGERYNLTVRSIRAIANS